MSAGDRNEPKSEIDKVVIACTNISNIFKGKMCIIKVLEKIHTTVSFKHYLTQIIPIRTHFTQYRQILKLNNTAARKLLVKRS